MDALQQAEMLVLHGAIREEMAKQLCPILARIRKSGEPIRETYRRWAQAHPWDTDRIERIVREYDDMRIPTPMMLSLAVSTYLHTGRRE